MVKIFFDFVGEMLLRVLVPQVQWTFFWKIAKKHGHHLDVDEIVMTLDVDALVEILKVLAL